MKKKTYWLIPIPILIAGGLFFFLSGEQEDKPCTEAFKEGSDCCRGLTILNYRNKDYCVPEDAEVICDEICTDKEGYYVTNKTHKRFLDGEVCRPKVPPNYVNIQGNSINQFYVFAYAPEGISTLEYDNICCRTDQTHNQIFQLATKLKEAPAWQIAPQIKYSRYDDGNDIGGWHIMLNPFNHGYHIMTTTICYDYDTGEELQVIRDTLTAGSHMMDNPYLAGAFEKPDKPRRLRCELSIDGGLQIVNGRATLYYEVCEVERNPS